VLEQRGRERIAPGLVACLGFRPTRPARLLPHVAQEAVGFERDIRPLFRERDINSMSFAFDLSSYKDVQGSAEAIYRRLAEGSMPCDGRWPAEQVQRFRTWIDTGCAP
jgi:hypothetical protein